MFSKRNIINRLYSCISGAYPQSQVGSLLSYNLDLGLGNLTELLHCGRNLVGCLCPHIGSLERIRSVFFTEEQKEHLTSVKLIFKGSLRPENLCTCCTCLDVSEQN
jgi:hypothetical protein